MVTLVEIEIGDMRRQCSGFLLLLPYSKIVDNFYLWQKVVVKHWL